MNYIRTESKLIEKICVKTLLLLLVILLFFFRFSHSSSPSLLSFLGQSAMIEREKYDTSSCCCVFQEGQTLCAMGYVLNVER